MNPNEILDPVQRKAWHKARAHILGNLARVAQEVGGTIRTSVRGVPHVVFDLEGVTYSVAYFNSTHTFRLFWPYPSYEREQHAKNFRGIPALLEYLGLPVGEPSSFVGMGNPYLEDYKENPQ